MKNIKQQLEKILGKGKILTDENLAKYTTYKIGGPARYFYKALYRNDLITAINSGISLSIPVYILGSGSNLLVADDGVEGLVIKNETNEIKIIKRIGSIKNQKINLSQILIEVDSGVLVNRLVRYCCDEGYQGFERHLGLPGTIGGAIYMNSKWTKPYVSIGDLVYEAKLLTKNKIVTVDKNYFKFAYDYSILQERKNYVLSVTFLLHSALSKDLWKIANSSIDYRRLTQPFGIATAGCTFRNIAPSDAIRLGTPNYTTSAGYLLDNVGLKNFQIGQVKYSDKHANFIYNLGGGKASDIIKLIVEGKKRVFEKYRINLIPEIVLWGFK